MRACQFGIALLVPGLAFADQKSESLLIRAEKVTRLSSELTATVSGGTITTNPVGTVLLQRPGSRGKSIIATSHGLASDLVILKPRC